MKALSAAKSENAMATQRQICPTLQSHYNLPASAKIKFLKTPEAQDLFDNIPQDVSQILKQGFLEGQYGSDVPNWDLVVDFFQRNSRIIPALTQNPGTFAMLEKMYHFQPVWGPIDNYFKIVKAGGQALRNRFDIINSLAIFHVNEILGRQNQCLVIDIGSGSGRNGIEMCLRSPNFRDKVHIDCIEIDQKAVIKGCELLTQHGLTNIEFVQTSMTRLRKRYPGNVDYGLLVGILCGLTHMERVDLLKSIKSYFKPGAKLVAASLLEKMAEDDLLCAYILREITGWGLQYPVFGKLKETFEKAGWKYEGFFQEEPTKFYEIGIGIA